VALNPIIKFTTLFGILAVEIAVNSPRGISLGIGAAFFLIGLFFVLRSFYGMRISTLHPQAHIDFNVKRAADEAGA
jgi:K(+)-stimulated pyrophosphate-energized sodium pump